MECKYCNNIFKTSSILKNHQQSAKYCLKIQNNIEKAIMFNCEHCGSKLTSKHRLITHLISCSVNIPFVQDKFKEKDKELSICNTRIKELEKQLEIYKALAERELDCMESIAKQPRTTNTQTNNNLNLLTPMDLNRESFSKTIKEAFGDNYLLEGQKGIARFAFDKLLKDEKGNLKYVCTDPSRQTYRFKALDGTIERDIKAKKLTSAIAEDVIRHSYTISKEKIQNGDSEVFLLYSNNITDINDISTDNGNFRNELASLTST
jgi:hypothetical protein